MELQEQGFLLNHGSSTRRQKTIKINGLKPLYTAKDAFNIYCIVKLQYILYIIFEDTNSCTFIES